MTILEVTEGTQYIRRGEGIIFSITTTNWESSPVASDITIIRRKDNTDVTSTFTSSATPSVASDVITLPEITVPANAQIGLYVVTAPFTVGGYSPGRPFFFLEVRE